MVFNIGDLVSCKNDPSRILEVTGVIHDEERLFVLDSINTDQLAIEFEISFDEVVKHYIPQMYY
jgi:hypothetical protein